MSDKVIVAEKNKRELPHQPSLFCLRKETRMGDLIDRDAAIEVLARIKAEHERRTCSRESLRQADALAYAIAVLKQVPKVETNAGQR